MPLQPYRWYEEKSPGLGEDLLRMFYAHATEVQRNPLLYPEIYRKFRRRLLRRFPYAIYYKVETVEVIIFGLFHCARDPKTVRAELQDRDKP
ncbi:type II toxin-antitoxin system RelE/ParE family toxin [candidate division KSB1 bacterium]|nr:type II toxin-antitoxin system RelE/ParE family toxin [candidate division KSB1 bacterium]NIT72714.1 type II toxin-antitoxin system RelE/ParE family toxin [candidate division KSB1 bacterium]NIX72394.1 type II toxin-antitoxin system RelE/ParE family toxin [candidate division KSB1 bacterium]